MDMVSSRRINNGIYNLAIWRRIILIIQKSSLITKRMKNKKSKLVVDKTGGLILAGIGLLILILILVPSENLGPLGRAKNYFLEYVLGFVPQSEPPDFNGKSEVPIELEDYYDSIVDNLRNRGVTKPCRIALGEKPEFKDFAIIFKEEKVEIRDEKKPSSVPHRQKDVSGFKPCSVTGVGQYKEEEVTINDDSDIASFLVRFDENHVCIVPSNFKSINQHNYCS